MTDAATITRALGGKWHKDGPSGPYGTAKCPAHADNKPSLTLRDGRRAVLLKCHANCNARDVLDALRRRGLLAGVPAAAHSASTKAERKRHRGTDDQELWQRIWKDARDPRGTPVDSCLALRHLILPPDASDCLRIHPHCPFGKDENGRAIYTPCMVALVRNIVSNEPQAIHRTALDLSGRKVTIGGHDRMALGPIAGGAVKLTADENVTIAIGVGEGIETTLSLQRIPQWANSPVWSLLNDNGVTNFPVLAGIETLVVAVDHDEAGEKAALAVAERWRAAGREILMFEANDPDEDLNDVIGR